MRLGIPCSSEFHKIFTPKTGKVSKSSEGYLDKLLYEWLSGDITETYQSEYMVRGQAQEDEAVRAYEGLAEVETERGGFITNDAGTMGCSPDRLIGTNGDLEIKNPAGNTQVGYARRGLVDEDYNTQLQGRLLIHGREYVDIFPYHRWLIIPAKRVYRDEPYIAKLKDALEEFINRMLAAREDLEKRFGPFIREDKAPPLDPSITGEDTDEAFFSNKFPKETYGN
jgi:hypothetical protein